MGNRSSSPESTAADPYCDDRTLDGSVDLAGRPVRKSRTGGTKAAAFIVGVELSERLSYYGIQANLFAYLTGVMQESVPEAIKNTTTWTGVTLVVPIVGGFVADAYWGRYTTIAIVSIVYVLGMALLTLCASIKPLKPTTCKNLLTCPKPTKLQVGVFFLALYLISLGTGGIKPCLEAFGADQFDEEDPYERRRKSSFFNWWYFALCFGGLIAVTVLVYLDDNVSWELGFGIPTLVMFVGCLLFFVGTRHYRHKLPGGSPLTQISQVLVASVRNWPISKRTFATNNALLYEEHIDPSLPTPRRQLQHTSKLKFLDNAAIRDPSSMTLTSIVNASPWKLCTVTQVEEVKQVICVMPIWLTTFAYGVVFAQSSTLFTSQAKTLDASLGSHGFRIPPASFQAFMTLTVLIFLPIYDRVFVPIARKFTGNERGISLLQRIGIGLFLSALCMVTAALVEARRLKVVRHSGNLDNPKVILPMSAFWLLPQYILLGLADVFTLVGEQEFFYDQVPDSMRSLGMALYLSANGVGSFISTLLVTIVTSVSGKRQWILTNINRSRVDLFYWLLVVLSMVNLLIFMIVAYFYEYKKVKRLENQRQSIEVASQNAPIGPYNGYNESSFK